MKTLLERAREGSLRKTKYVYNDEAFRLAVAYMNGEVPVGGVLKVMEFKHHGQITHWVATAIKRGIKEGKVNLSLTQPHESE